MLAGEGSRQIFGRHRSLTLVQKLHVATERDRGKGDLRAIRGGADPPGFQRLTEADRESQDLEAEAAGDPEVTELVDGDQEPHGDHEPQRVPDDTHARAPSSDRPAVTRQPPAMRSEASRLASASAASTSSRPPITPAVHLVITCSMTAAIPGKFNRRSRKACTATSLAAFRATGVSPPACAADCASARQRNFCGSGARKSSLEVFTRSRNSTPEAILSGHASAYAMGVRMSGEPSCAMSEPSRYSTREWMMLCGCTTMSTRSGVSAKRKQASISSSPLFMRVAESTEIFRPITQLGWAQAASGVAAAIASAPQSRNGPPEAVSRIRRTPFGVSPVREPAGRHWNMALCSLSIGSSVAPLERAACINSGPDMTSDSLLASNRRLPARAAASVERKPAAPTIAAMTHSASGSVAISVSAPAPAMMRVPLAVAPSSRASSRAAPSSAMAA